MHQLASRWREGETIRLRPSVCAVWIYRCEWRCGGIIYKCRFVAGGCSEYFKSYWKSGSRSHWTRLIVARSKNASEMPSKCTRNAVEMLSKFIRNTFEMHSKCFRNALKMVSNCTQNALEMQSQSLKSSSSDRAVSSSGLDDQFGAYFYKFLTLQIVYNGLWNKFIGSSWMKKFTDFLINLFQFNQMQTPEILRGVHCLWAPSAIGKLFPF